VPPTQFEVPVHGALVPHSQAPNLHWFPLVHAVAAVPLPHRHWPETHWLAMSSVHTVDPHRHVSGRVSEPLGWQIVFRAHSVSP
jgi:hypothetical protein